MNVVTPIAADTTVRWDRPHAAAGTSTALAIDPDDRSRVLVRFDVEATLAALADETLQFAELQVAVAWNDGRWGSGEPIDVHRVTGAWTEAGATWSCPDDADTANAGADCAAPWELDDPTSGPYVATPTDAATIDDSTNGTVSFDVTADVMSLLEGAVAAHDGWLVKKRDEAADGAVAFSAKEAGGAAPRLVLWLVEKSSPSSTDADGDGFEDSADPCPLDPFNDIDLDGLCGDVDNCGGVPNPTQADMDNDGVGDACDMDADGDGFSGHQRDCDDRDSAVHPGAPEICDDGIDQSCSGWDAPCAPPDPATVAPPLDTSVPVRVHDMARFLYEGSASHQRDVAPDAVELRRAALLRGQVRDRAGNGVPGVRVRVVGDPELGYGVSQADGRYDIAVNGGRRLTLEFEKDGYLLVQRTIDIGWNESKGVDAVVLTSLDGAVTRVSGSNTPLVHTASVVTDGRGTRQARLMFPGGVQATAVLEDGSIERLPRFDVRVTEYTSGPEGPAAMPAFLPPSSAYTYAAELSVDQALSARSVRFSAPIAIYLDNFLALPVGTIVPSGTYDRQIAQWVPERNGLVIEIVDIVNGMAEIDSDGDGVADPAPQLAALGIDEEERASLAGSSVVGAQVWRAEVAHFTPIDLNFMIASSSRPPPANDEQDSPIEGSCEIQGSVIDVSNQALGEVVPLTGTTESLHYRSDRTPGSAWQRQLHILVTDASPPASLIRATVSVEIAGQRIRKEFPPLADTRFGFTWDGKDAYGRDVLGPQVANVTVSYWYELRYRTYRCSDEQPPLFGRRADLPSSCTPEIVIVQEEVERSREARYILRAEDARATGLGGWTLTNHHTYAVSASELKLGNGRRRTAQALPPIAELMAGRPEWSFDESCMGDDGAAAVDIALHSPEGIAIDEEGGFYVAEWTHIRHIDSAGRAARVVEMGVPCGDSSVVLARGPMALAHDGSLYVASSSEFVCRIDPDGTVHHVAGADVSGEDYSGDGGPAVLASFYRITDIALGPDGVVYLADNDNARVRAVGLDGVVHTIAGRGPCNEVDYASPAEDVPATQSCVNPVSLVVTGDGTLYVGTDTFEVQNKQRAYVRSVTSDGIIRTVAGDTTMTSVEYDGVPADRILLEEARAIAVGRGHTLYVSDYWNSRILQVVPGGMARLVAGAGASSSEMVADGHPAIGTDLSAPVLEVDPDGDPYVLSTSWYPQVFRIRRPLPDRPLADVLVPDPAEGALYRFDVAGRHLETLDLLTGAVRYTFAYDPEGRLSSVTDRDGLETRIERDGAGAPAAIVAPYGQRTALALDGTGWLSRVEHPDASTHQVVYAGGGLLETFTDRRGHTSVMAYGPDGRLLRDDDAALGYTDLVRTFAGGDSSVEVTTAEGVQSTYSYAPLDSGDEERDVVRPDGLRSTLSVNKTGERWTTTPDGTTRSIRLTPDPRFAMAAAFAGRQEVDPPGALQYRRERTRTVTLADPNDPHSLTSQTDAIVVNGRSSRRTFDVDRTTGDRTVTVVSAEGREAIKILNEKERPTRFHRTGQYPVLLTYDVDGRLTTIAHGDPGAPATQRWTSFTYGNDGLVDSVTDPQSRVSGYARDVMGRVTQMTLPDGRVVLTGYDANGNVTSITPPGRSAHVFDYSEVDLPTEYDPPSAFAGSDMTTYAYNKDRQLTSVTRPDGAVVSFSYDTAGRRSTLTFSRGTLIYGYDASTGRLSTVTGPEIETVTLHHDGFLPTQTLWSGTVTGSVEHVYSNDFLISARKVNGASVASFSYDDDLLLTGAGPLVLTRDLDNGLLLATALGSLSTSHHWSAYGEPSAFTASHGATDLLGFDYTRDDLGRVTTLIEARGTTITTWGYEYDLAGRLYEVTKDGAVHATYGWDDNSNRTSVTTAAGTTSATYDGQDRLVTFGDFTYGWAAAGELTSKTDSVTATTWAYEYDELGNLVSATLPDGTLIEYVIDGMNRRIGKKRDGVYEQGFLYQDQLNPIAELDGSNNVVTTFVYGTRANVPDLMVKGGVTYRILTDHLGSVRLVVDVATGVVAQELAYDVWGNVLVDTAPGFQPFGFAGGLYDRDTGLVRFGARDYDPQAGRWTAKDPILFSGGDTNLYGYVLQDPVNLIDPLGLYGSQYGLDLLGGCDSFARQSLIAMDSSVWQQDIANTVLSCRLLRVECRLYCLEEYDQCVDPALVPECNCDGVFEECVRENLAIPGDVCSNPALQAIADQMIGEYGPRRGGP